MRVPVLRRGSTKVAFMAEVEASADTPPAWFKRLAVQWAVAEDEDLSKTDLAGADLTGVDLTEQDLSGSDLTGADLTAAVLASADLSGTELRGARLNGCDLTEADLSNACLSGCSLAGAKLTEADLSGADLTGTILTDAVLVEADLSNANLTGADLSGADLTEADLSNARLVGVRLDGVRLTGADLDGAEMGLPDDAERPHAEAIAAAHAVLDRFMAAINAQDEAGVNAAFNFPHVRFASAKVTIFEKRGDFRMETFRTRVDKDGWARSSWDKRQIIHAGPDKVQFDTQFSRWRADGSRIGAYQSIYIVTRVDGHWGIQARSSYAA